LSAYILAEEAMKDLEAIWDYIAQDNLDAADRWTDRLFATFEALADRPGMGHMRRDLTELPLLFWPVGAYIVIYRKQRTDIEIVAVAHGARDIPVLLTHRRE
jgi:plasmid stabilization system protein ParE